MDHSTFHLEVVFPPIGARVEKAHKTAADLVERGNLAVTPALSACKRARTFTSCTRCSSCPQPLQLVRLVRSQIAALAALQKVTGSLLCRAEGRNCTI